MPPSREVPCVLSIAGSDSGGGAGIQADLKAFARCGVHGMTAITAITAQSTVGVDAVIPVAPEAIIAQVVAVARDLGVDAVKIGMLGTVATIEAVAQALDELSPQAPIVLDPVMAAESGAELLEPMARAALADRLVPRATVVTPNVPEARALAALAAPTTAPGPIEPDMQRSGRAAARSPREEIAERAEVVALARSVLGLGCRAVVVTGGHRDRVTDLFVDPQRVVEIPGERHPSDAVHGSGCTHSSVLAAALALGCDPLEAAGRAKALAAGAVRDGLSELGAGSGPVDVLGLREMRQRGC